MDGAVYEVNLDGVDRDELHFYAPSRVPVPDRDEPPAEAGVPHEVFVYRPERVAGVPTFTRDGHFRYILSES